MSEIQRITNLACAIDCKTALDSVMFKSWGETPNEMVRDARCLGYKSRILDSRLP